MENVAQWISWTGGPKNAAVAASRGPAHANGIALIPLVVNKDVDPGVGHAILADPAKRAALAQNLVNEAKTYGYAGFQLDFEQIPWTDRDLLTAIVTATADAFHQQGLQLSIAVVPGAPGTAGESPFAAWIYANWRGAYDLAALGKAVDILCLMTWSHQPHQPERALQVDLYHFVELALVHFEA